MEGTRCTVVYYTAEGLTMDKVRDYYTKIEENTTNMSGGKMTLSSLDEDAGRTVRYSHV